MEDENNVAIFFYEGRKRSARLPFPKISFRSRLMDVFADDHADAQALRLVQSGL